MVKRKYSDFKIYFQPVSFLNEEMRNLFYGLLKASDRCRNQVLTWFGDCLYANKGRFSSFFYIKLVL